MKQAGWILAAVCVVLLGGCKPTLRDAKVDAQVHSVFDQLQRHQYAALTTQLAPELAAQVGPNDLAKVASYLPGAAPTDRTEVSTQFSNVNGVQTVSATDDYSYASGAALVETVLRKSGPSGPWLVEGLNVRFATHQQLAVNRFTLSARRRPNTAFCCS